MNNQQTTLVYAQQTRHICPPQTSQWNQKHRGFAPVWLMELRCLGRAEISRLLTQQTVSRADTSLSPGGGFSLFSGGAQGRS